MRQIYIEIMDPENFDSLLVYKPDERVSVELLYKEYQEDSRDELNGGRGDSISQGSVS